MKNIEIIPLVYWYDVIDASYTTPWQGMNKLYLELKTKKQNETQVMIN